MHCLLALKIDSYVLFNSITLGLQPPKLKKILLIYQKNKKPSHTPKECKHLWLGTLAINNSFLRLKIWKVVLAYKYNLLQKDISLF